MKKPRHNLPTFVFAFIVVPLFGATFTSAQDSGDVECGECCSSAECCCDLWSRPQLTGDWQGIRPAMADRGITLDADVTQFYEGVASGGLQQQFRYSGHGDYVLKFDFDKLSGQEGLFLQLRAEHRFGRALNLNDTGTFAATSVLANLPSLNTEDLLLTNVVITQALSEQFVVFLGKVDTLDGDMNAFAHGRGKTQFLNTNFVFNPIAVQTVPYSTLGAGFSILRDFEQIFSFSVLNATDTTTTSGFNELFADGVALVAEARLPTNLLGLPGHQGIGAGWNSKEYIALNQDPRIVFPGVPIAAKDGSWNVKYNFDQYLYVDPCDSTRGWGIFGRAGISDGNPNPLHWIVSFGVGGNSPICGREADRFGIGWYYGAASPELGPFFTPDNGTGVEMFYNIAVTPWFELTPDLQILDGGLRTSGTAVICALRGNLCF
jgi:porin